MDNLTHSLVGAVLGQAGLKRKTALAMPTLIIAANIPDIDAVAVLLGGHLHLAIRRGITHGPIAMLVLPLILWATMLAYDRWRPKADRPPVQKGWLLALAYVGCVSHPLFDWFNSYGIRLLEPFSSQWFYGDTLFIIDIWIWATLIGSVWLSRRRERQGQGSWRRPAAFGFAAILAYITANGLVSERAEGLAGRAIKDRLGTTPTLVVANPVPVQFWKRDLQWRNDEVYGFGKFSFPDDVFIHGKVRPHGIGVDGPDRPGKMIADAKAFLFWSRMPVADVSGDGANRRLLISDQRFNDPRVADRFKLSIPLNDATAR